MASNNLKAMYMLLCLILGYQNVSGQYYYEFNERCKAAYEAFVSLKIKEGQMLVEQELSRNPQNLIPVFIANYGDCLTLMLNGNDNDYKQMKPNMDKRLKLLDKGDASDPWFLYCKAAVNFQWATVRLRFNEYFSGATEFRKSYLQLKENQKKFPDFKYTQVLLGLEEAIVGTIPDNYKWIVNILGMHGNMRGGIAKISGFLNDKSPAQSFLREEAIFYYCYLKFYLFSEKKQVWNYINTSDLDLKNNLLFTYMAASLAIDDNKADLATSILLNRNKSSSYLHVPLFDYQSGVVSLQKMDDSAVIYFKRFLDQYAGRFFIKSTYQKISQYYILSGDLNRANHYKKAILNVGTTEIDIDKQANRYAKTPALPKSSLLKARLYCDGGYFSKALTLLNAVKISDLEMEELIEYYYRLGHVYYLTQRYKNAIPYFINAISLGKGSKGQYAARSALELAETYEKSGNRTKAIENFKLCLSMKNHDFQSAIDQRAKSGLSRLQDR